MQNDFCLAVACAMQQSSVGSTACIKLGYSLSIAGVALGALTVPPYLSPLIPVGWVPLCCAFLSQHCLVTWAQQKTNFAVSFALPEPLKLA